MELYTYSDSALFLKSFWLKRKLLMTNIIHINYKRGFGIKYLFWHSPVIIIILISPYLGSILMMYAQFLKINKEKIVKIFKFPMLLKIKWCFKHNNKISKIGFILRYQLHCSKVFNILDFFQKIMTTCF
jgi:hypothetical protein